MRQNHIALICSSEQSLIFYSALGFTETERRERGYDTIVWMSDGFTKLEIFIDPTHPARVDCPEANGLRHLEFDCEHIEQFRETLAEWNPEPIVEKFGKRVFFVKDPDGCPVEIMEYIPQPPSENGNW